MLHARQQVAVYTMMERGGGTGLMTRNFIACSTCVAISILISIPIDARTRRPHARRASATNNTP